ncbi:DEAD/DEAH box helicase [Methanospirillum sp.]|uniref:DEAD/DEAH box helicase n=1 Tax=Methanospirillum sp. TaxID=45200 RepID=UPI00359FC3F3
MSVSEFLDFLLENRRYSGYIAHIQKIPGNKAVFSPVPDVLPAGVKDWLSKEGMRLYSHQVEAIEAIAGGEDVILCTPTASGKTLSFLLPFLSIRQQVRDATALAIYPAKALTRDQYKTMQELEKATGMRISPAIYDGDTPQHDRPLIREQAGLILTNPYELHQILPWHRQWSSFFSRLRYIILDEAHQYRGVFGSSISSLIRRLLRICEHYGSNPQFFLSSATLANPAVFACHLTGRETTIIDTSGAPTGDRFFILYNPYQEMVQPRSVYSESAEILSILVDAGLQSLCFTGSRRMTEMVSVWAKNSLSRKSPDKINCIAAYRAGYLPKERQELEQNLKSGNMLGLVSTNALELGINIGSLDAVVMTGYPGTMMSVWQQAGRAGRSVSDALAILIAMQNPLDQFFMRHPEEFFSRPHEYAIIDTKNPYILSGQLLCAASELPVRPESDIRWFGKKISEHLEALVGNGLVARTPRGYVYTGLKRAGELVSLSQISEVWTVEVKNRVIETVDIRQACREAHPGAVLIHQGERYLVSSWDFDRRRIFADREDPGYYTRVNHQTGIEIRERLISRDIRSGTLCLGRVSVSEQYTGYRRLIDEKTISTEPLSLKPITFETKSVWIEFSQEGMGALSVDRDVDGSLHGAEHALIAMMPYHVLCDRWDLGGLSSGYSAQARGRSVIFIYDGYEGGIGLAERAYHIYEELCQSAEKMVRECRCKDGCPACIYSPKCGNDNQPLDKKGCIALLQHISS